MVTYKYFFDRAKFDLKLKMAKNSRNQRLNYPANAAYSANFFNRQSAYLITEELSVKLDIFERLLYPYAYRRARLPLSFGK